MEKVSKFEMCSTPLVMQEDDPKLITIANLFLDTRFNNTLIGSTIAGYNFEKKIKNSLMIRIYQGIVKKIIEQEDALEENGEIAFIIPKKIVLEIKNENEISNIVIENNNYGPARKFLVFSPKKSKEEEEVNSCMISGGKPKRHKKYTKKYKKRRYIKTKKYKKTKRK